jgi:hypothetical protein
MASSTKKSPSPAIRAAAPAAPKNTATAASSSAAAGHVRVTVSENEAKVDYVRSIVPGVTKGRHAQCQRGAQLHDQASIPPTLKSSTHEILITTTALLCLAASALAKAPNILFILADDQSWSGTSVRMMPAEAASGSREFRTPNLEKLAAQGMTFSQAYAAHCKCECSRAAIQMGRTTTTLNAPDKMSRNWSAPVTDSLVNTLKKADRSYQAAHFGKWQWFHTPESMGYDASDGITMNEDGDSTDPEDPKLSFSMTRRAKAFMDTQVKSGHPFLPAAVLLRSASAHRRRWPTMKKV